MLKETKVTVLTYPVKHRKTYDVLSLLKVNGYKDVDVCAVPFSYVKKHNPSINHRPELNYHIPSIEVVCRNLEYKYQYKNSIEEFDIPCDRTVLVAGAGILPEDFVATHTVINSHPGYLPNCRGLDALKWAIIENEPIGVTTHLIGDYVDAGEIIERRQITIYKNDTFHSVANRVYENEVTMLVEAIDKTDKTEIIMPGDSMLHKRMPEDLEKKLFDSFENYKCRYAK